MNNDSNTPEKAQTPKEKQVSKKEIEEFTSQLAKKITTMNKKKVSRNRYLPFNVNPFVVLVTFIVGFFVVLSILSRNTFSQKVSLTEVINGLDENNYSQIIVQNDGSIYAKEKNIYYTTESGDFSVPKDKGIKITNGSDIEDIQLSEFKDLLKQNDIVAQIRSLFGKPEERVTQVLLGDDYAYVITNGDYKDKIIDNISREEFNDFLRDEDINLSDFSVTTYNLKYFAKEISKESLQSRIDNLEVTNVFEINGDSFIKLSDSAVAPQKIDWTPSIYTFTDILQQEGFKIASEDQNFEYVTANIAAGITFDTILTLLSIVVFVFLGFVIFRSAQASGMGIVQFGQSKAKMFFGKKTGVTFKDVAGIDEAREELNEIVDFLRNPAKYRKLGARIPKGILMFGAPGTGKTLLARAIAGEAGVPFFHTSGSEFEEMLVGAGASRVRDLFMKAKKAAPALIFIDEIDAVARKRGTRIQSGSTEQTLNQILVEMDGFENNTNVIVIAATNRPDVLDDAILRPGRFDRQVRIESPDKDGRKEILDIHGKNKPFAKDVDLNRVAKRTVGFTGADLENILNEAAIIAAKAERKEISMHDIDEAVSKVVLGPAKKSRKRTEDELKLVAYHEAGHALVSRYVEGSTPVDRISIVSRGSSGGVTMFLPETDENIISKNKLLADIRVSLGGRAAEEVALKDISTGASSDIEKATRVARQMIQRFGMSDTGLGMVQYGDSNDSEYLGYHYGESKNFSEDTARRIDDEVRDMINKAYKEVVDLLKDKRSMLDKLANLLLDKEVMDKEEFEALFDQEEGKNS